VGTLEHDLLDEPDPEKDLSVDYSHGTPDIAERLRCKRRTKKADEREDGSHCHGQPKECRKRNIECAGHRKPDDHPSQEAETRGQESDRKSICNLRRVNRSGIASLSHMIS